MYKLLQSYSTPGCTIARGTIGEYSNITGGYYFKSLEGDQVFFSSPKVHNTKDWFEKVQRPQDPDIDVSFSKFYGRISILVKAPYSEELANKLTAAIRSVL